MNVFITTYSCDFNLRDKDGRTALHIAVTMNNSHIVKLLISKGIDVTIEDNTGKTAEQLSYSMVSGHNTRMHLHIILSAGKCKLLRCACKSANRLFHYKLN